MIRNHVSLPKPVHVKSDLEKTNSFYYVDAVDVPRFFTNLSSKYKQPIERFIKNIEVRKLEIPLVIRVATSRENKVIVDIGYVYLPNIRCYIENYGYFKTPISASKFILPISEVKYG